VKNEQVDDDDLIRFANELILRDIRIPIITDKLNTPLFVQVLEDHLVTSKANNQLLLPDLRQKNQTIGVFSDYGGEAADSKYLIHFSSLATTVSASATRRSEISGQNINS